MAARPLNLLVLCTANSARSLLGEALLNHLGAGRLRAYSAGSRPAGQPNRLALDVLEAHGVPVAGLASKGWDTFAQPGAPEIDVVITVCDAAAAEACPLFPGSPLRVHWGLADPAAFAGDETTRRAAFEGAFAELEHRVRRMLALPLEELEGAELQARLQACASDAMGARA